MKGRLGARPPISIGQDEATPRVPISRFFSAFSEGGGGKRRSERQVVGEAASETSLRGFKLLRINYLVP